MNQKVAAEYLGMSVDSFVRHVRMHLPRAYVAGKVLYPRKDLDAWIERVTHTV